MIIHEKVSFNKKEELMSRDLDGWLRGKEHLSVTQVLEDAMPSF